LALLGNLLDCFARFCGLAPDAVAF